MQYIRRLSDYRDCRDSAVTFGKFDGLHLGHQKLVEQVQKLSKEEGLSSVLCSFDMHPLWESKGICPRILMTSEERIRHLDGKIDYLVEYPFTQEFSQMSAEDFIKDIIMECFHARYIVVGPDFRFGYQKRGTVQMLEQYAGNFGYQVIVIEKERYQQQVISSTYIKDVLKQGDAALARRLLGYPYEVQGIVERGNRLGRTLGFPTLNVVWPMEKMLPAKGVYFSQVRMDGFLYQGISNVGVKPTVSKEDRVLIETYLYVYHEDAYGKKVSIGLLEYQRPEKRFESVDALKASMERDIAYGEYYFQHAEEKEKGEYK